MEAYAVIETGGKQYRVVPGQEFEIERLPVEPGQDINVDKVLALSDESGLKVGTPLVEGASVVLTVLEALRGPKIFNFKKKRRKGYTRKVGHRQELLRVKVKSIA